MSWPPPLVIDCLPLGVRAVEIVFRDDTGIFDRHFVGCRCIGSGSQAATVRQKGTQRPIGEDFDPIQIGLHSSRNGLNGSDNSEGVRPNNNLCCARYCEHGPVHLTSHDLGRVASDERWNGSGYG